ncbi:MAG: SBBP repeat-containing protein [Chloroflexota bacterium]
MRGKVGRVRGLVTVLLLVALSGCLPQPLPERSTPTALLAPPTLANPTAPTIWSRGRLPVYFVENQGQANPRVAYYASSRGATAYFTAESVTYVLRRKPARPAPRDERPPAESAAPDAGSTPTDSLPSRWAVQIDFLGADPEARPNGLDRTEAVFSYFKGRPDQWHTGVSTYRGVAYHDLWPGINLEYVGDNDHLKYSFVVQPGADPHRIALAYRGAETVRLTEQGGLESVTPLGTIREAPPLTYQELDGQRTEVPSSYVLDSDPELGAHVVGFEVGPYDHALPIVIDPTQVVYAGFIGGSDDEIVNGIAVDSQGAAYVAGETASTEGDFPDGDPDADNHFEAPGFDQTQNGGADAFVAKVSPNGSALVYASFLGSSSADIAEEIAIDGSGNAYVIGRTSGSQTSTIPFPISNGAYQPIHNGITSDGFVTKIDPAGTAIVYSTYVGGSDFDIGLGIALVPGCQSACSTFITGITRSADLLPAGLTGPDPTFNGTVANPLNDAFVARLNAGGTALDYGSYIGGINSDIGESIAVDPQGNAYVAGTTSSSETTFPNGSGIGGNPGQVNAPGFDQTQNGQTDVFVVKIVASGASFGYVTYLGGVLDEEEVSLINPPKAHIAVDSSGSAYVTGATESGSGSVLFPTAVGPDTTHAGGFDAFITKLNPAGTQLVYSGFIGGSNNELPGGVAVDSTGAAYVTGSTTSTTAQGFPIVNGQDNTLAGSSDVFLAKVLPDGTGFKMSTYLGGDDLDQATGIAVDAAGSAYIAGETFSTESTHFPVKSGPDLTFNGGQREGFVAKIGTTADLKVAQSDTADPVTVGQNVTYSLTITNLGPANASSVQLVDTLPANVSLVSTSSPTGATCGPNVAGVVTCSIGTILTTTFSLITITVHPNTFGTFTNNVSLTSTEGDPNPANNDDPETTTVQPICTPRPPVSVQTTPGAPGSGTLNAAISAQSSAGVPGNFLSQIRLTSVVNALVDLLGLTGLSGAQTLNTTGKPATVNLTVHFVPRNTFSTVRLVAVDGCGDWPTLVGAGPSVTH